VTTTQTLSHTTTVYTYTCYTDVLSRSTSAEMALDTNTLDQCTIMSQHWLTSHHWTINSYCSGAVLFQRSTPAQPENARLKGPEAKTFQFVGSESFAFTVIGQTRSYTRLINLLKLHKRKSYHNWKYHSNYHSLIVHYTSARPFSVKTGLRLGLGLRFRFHNFTDRVPFLQIRASQTCRCNSLHKLMLLIYHCKRCRNKSQPN